MDALHRVCDSLAGLSSAAYWSETANTSIYLKFADRGAPLGAVGKNGTKQAISGQLSVKNLPLQQVTVAAAGFCFGLGISNFI